MHSCYLKNLIYNMKNPSGNINFITFFHECNPHSDSSLSSPQLLPSFCIFSNLLMHNQHFVYFSVLISVHEVNIDCAL
jgi:hypothetical protein